MPFSLWVLLAEMSALCLGFFFVWIVSLAMAFSLSSIVLLPVIEDGVSCSFPLTLDSMQKAA